MIKSKKDYINHLNELAPPSDSDEWIFEGKYQKYHAIRGMYGQALRLYDPIAFNTGYNDWKREKSEFL